MLIKLIKRFVLIIILVAFATIACEKKESVEVRQMSGSRALFVRNCAICHGPNGEGKQIGNLTVPNLRTGRALTDADERLMQQIHNGGNGMPPFKYTLTDDEIQDLVRFIRQDLQASQATGQVHNRNLPRQ